MKPHQTADNPQKTSKTVKISQTIENLKKLFKLVQRTSKTVKIRS